MLRRRALNGAALVLALALWSLPAAADQTVGGACTSSTADAAQSANGNNLVCISSVWQYPAYQFGSSSATCNSTNAGITQYVGGLGGSMQYCNATSWTTLSAVGVIPLSRLAAATTTNTINNGSNAQVWNWNTLAGTTALTLSTTSTAPFNCCEDLINLSLSGANANSSQTTYAEQISNTHTGTSSTNVGLYVNVSGGTYNYAALFQTGKVGIGTATPSLGSEVEDWSGAADGVRITTASQSPNSIMMMNTTFGSTDFTGFNLFQWDNGVASISSNNTYATALNIDTSGNVAMGNHSPVNKLTVTGDGAGVAQIGSMGCGGNYVGLALSTTGTASGCTNYNVRSSPTDQDLYINRPSGHDIVFSENNGTAQIDIHTGGYVGIGIVSAAPLAPFQVGDTGDPQGIMVIPDSSTVIQDPAAIRTYSGNLNLDTYGGISFDFDTDDSGPATDGFWINQGSGATNRIFIDGSGDLDIATAGTYLNFGATTGTGGYGFRDNAGHMQKKNSGGSWADINTTSDRRVKRGIVDLPETDGLAAIMKLRPVRFHWKDVEKERDEGEQIGLIAQEVETVFPSGGLTYNFGNVTMTLPDGKKETVEHARGMNYERLVAPLIKAVQEQNVEMEKQDGDFAELQKEIADLKGAAARH